MKKSSLLLLSVLSITALTSCNSAALQDNKPVIRNVILMIGDGMGLPHVYAAMTVSADTLNIAKCKTTGLQTNYSADNYVTDSGASGTALATGVKTKNGSIGVDANGNSVRSILEIAEANGLSTGLVSTSALTHATPASFIAHQSSRGSYEQIAADFLKTDVDVIIGGGYDHFGKRQDNLNYIDSLKNKGYTVTTSLEETLASNSTKLAGFTAPVHNPYRLKGRGDMLPESTKKAIDILSKNNKGFFLMVEGSQIDWAAHANTADTLIDEVLDFDKAVGAALDFAKKDGHTLVVVTADHETGGVTLVSGDKINHTVTLNFATKDHTALTPLVYTYGPGSTDFTGFYDNTDIPKKIKKALGLK
ncbi:MAG TPA: alkaline phosphatase [Bacteroidales bacterium]|nr:alkaline phosphatase [Bacteroidales bacterium]